MTAFTRQVLGNFSLWDRDKDGQLSLTEIDSLVGDLRVRGEAAAALGALKMTVRGKQANPPPLTRSYFLRYAQYARSHKTKAIPHPLPPSEDEAVIETGDTGSAPPEFPGYDRLYSAARSRIKKAPPVLFTLGSPRLTQMQQGQIGDCYLVSMLGGMLNRDPARFRQMFTQQPDGTCRVLFPNGKTVSVHNLTDTEVAISSSSRGTGRWLAVLEEAYGHLKNEVLAEEDQKAVVTDLISHGGSQRACIRILTGHVAEGTNFRKKVKGKWRPPTPEYIASRLPGLRERLTQSLNAGLLVGGLVERYERPPGIVGNHAYAILSYDAVTDTVRVWNPHGNNFTPKGTPGLKNGYVTRSGVFILPLAEFVQVFQRADFETAESVKPTNSSDPHPPAPSPASG